MSRHFKEITNKSLDELSENISEFKKSLEQKKSGKKMLFESEKTVDLNPERKLKEYQSIMGHIKSENDKRKTTIENLIKQTFNMMEVEVRCEPLEPALTKRIKFNLD